MQWVFFFRSDKSIWKPFEDTDNATILEALSQVPPQEDVTFRQWDQNQLRHGWANNAEHMDYFLNLRTMRLKSGDGNTTRMVMCFDTANDNIMFNWEIVDPPPVGPKQAPPQTLQFKGEPPCPAAFEKARSPSQPMPRQAPPPPPRHLDGCSPGSSVRDLYAFATRPRVQLADGVVAPAPGSLFVPWHVRRVPEIATQSCSAPATRPVTYVQEPPETPEDPASVVSHDSGDTGELASHRAE